MPVWLQIFSELKITPKVVLCLRSPVQVAHSLQHHNGLDLEIAEYRWLDHMAEFFWHCRDMDFCTVEYGRGFDDPDSNLAKLRNFLHLPVSSMNFSIDRSVSEIIAPERTQYDTHLGEARNPLVRSLYALA